MKTIFLFVLLALACADKEPIPVVSGHWEGTMYLQKVPFNIRFNVVQYGDGISGTFETDLGGGLIQISDDSRYISGKMVIIADYPGYNAKLIFSGTWDDEDSMSGFYKITIYSESLEDFWFAFKK